MSDNAAPPTALPRATLGDWLARTQVAPLVALLLSVVLFLVGGLVNPNFVSVGQAVTIITLAAYLGIIAAGQTLVILSGGEGIDLSAGAVVTLAAILVYRYGGAGGLEMWGALALALGAGALVGLVNGLGVVVLGIPPLVMTLGTTGVVTGAVLTLTRGQMVGSTPTALRNFVVQPWLVPGVPGVLWAWLLLAVGMWLLLAHTPYGQQVYAVGVNRVAARLSGVRVGVVVALTYVTAGVLAALGGVVLLGFSGVVFLNLGGVYLFPSIAAVVVGGTVLAGGQGSYFGTMAGALVLTVLDSLLRAVRLPEAYQLMVLGGVLLLLLSVYGRQRGLRR